MLTWRKLVPNRIWYDLNISGMLWVQSLTISPALPLAERQAEFIIRKILSCRHVYLGCISIKSRSISMNTKWPSGEFRKGTCRDNSLIWRVFSGGRAGEDDFSLLARRRWLSHIYFGSRASPKTSTLIYRKSERFCDLNHARFIGLCGMSASVEVPS